MRLAPSGVIVKWVEFPAGPQLLEGLNVGSIDLAHDAIPWSSSHCLAAAASEQIRKTSCTVPVPV